MTVETLWDRSNRLPLLVACGATIATIALIDWWTLPYVSLGLLYLFPTMLAAGVLPRSGLLMLGVLCAGLSEMFSALDPAWRISRMIFETLAFAGCGLFVSELLRNRRLSLDTQQRLRILVETSPAAILTIKDTGVIDLANQAATELLLPINADLIGQPIDRFVPELRSALQPVGKTPFRTSMQCQGQRGSGESFLAEVWFSNYQENGTSKLAAIIADVSEEQSVTENHNQAPRPNLNSRQIAVLRLLLESLPNSEIATRLDMTGSAVKNALHQLFSKAGVRNRSQMVSFALERYRDLL